MNMTLKVLESSQEYKIRRGRFRYALVVYPLLLMIFIFGSDFLFPSIKIGYKMIALTLIGFALSQFLKKPEGRLLQEINEKVVGSLNFDEEQLIVETNDSKIQISASGNRELFIYFNSVFGEISRSGQSSQFHYGTDNYIELVDSGVKKKIYIWLEHEEDRETLQSISTWGIKSKLDVKEFTKGERTYFGKKMNYKEIQEMKGDQL